MSAPESWRQIDDALKLIAKRRGALDALEAKWLREALRTRIWREVGCVSMADYLERRLGYAPRTAFERVRVAVALEELPKLEAALANGLPQTAVRELTRVCTPENEQAWLDATRGKSVHQIEQMVAGRPKGGKPEDPPNPNLVARATTFEAIKPATMALLRDARRKAQEERGGALSDDDFLATLARTFLEGGGAERTKAPYQVAVVVCEHCNRGWQESGGRRYPLSQADVERACCDSERIGSLDADAPERAAQEVSPSVRRLVGRRDGGCCKLPGCRSTRCLEIHHIVPRAAGGSHEADNLILMCDGCHAAHHRGLIEIDGTAAELEVTRKHEITYDIETAHVGTLDREEELPPDPAPSRFEREQLHRHARTALVELGFRPIEATNAVDRALRHLGLVPIEDLVRQALRFCLPASAVAPPRLATDQAALQVDPGVGEGR